MRSFIWDRHRWRPRATYPEASDGPSSSASLFGLAPCGVLPAISLAGDAVRSYRTFSPLLAFALRASAHRAPEGPTASRHRVVTEGLPRRSAAELPGNDAARWRRRAKAGGIFSVPLSVGSPRPGVTRRTALWSSDFPPRAHERERAAIASAHCGTSVYWKSRARHRRHGAGRLTRPAPA